MLRAGVVALGSALLAAHLASELTLWDAPGPPLAYFLPGAAACGVGAFLLTLPPPVSWREDVHSLRNYVWIPLTTPLAWWAGVLESFAVAYLASGLIFPWLHIAARHGLLRYDPYGPGFVTSRSAFYATMRAAAHATAVHWDAPPRLVRLLPLLLSSAETLAMFAWRSEAYAFPTRSRAFAAYSLHKSVLFVCLPLIEDALLA